MITNNQFKEYIASKLGITLFSDYGSFESATRDGNTIKTPICGVYRMNPMTVTPLQGLLLASATANVDIAAEADSVAYVRALIDSVAASCNGETVTMEDSDGKSYIVTCSYSTAYVGTERTAPNNTGKMIPVSMTVYYSIIQNGVSSNDVKLTFDGEPIYFTEFSVSHQRVADSYATEEGTTKAAILQGVRSFDFVSPLLSSNLGKAFRTAILGNEGNKAHCFTVTLDGETYAYIGVFGNLAATAQPPQNVGSNISILEGDPATLTFDENWTSVNASFSVTLQAPAEGAKNIVFWGDGKTEVWDTTNGSLEALTHNYADQDTHTVYCFKVPNTRAARSAEVLPDQTFSFYANADNMTASLFTSDYLESADGYWRRNCTVDWGDGTSDPYNTMMSSVDDLPSGICHTYEAEGIYTVKIYNLEPTLWVSV